MLDDDCEEVKSARVSEQSTKKQTFKYESKHHLLFPFCLL